MRVRPKTFLTFLAVFLLPLLAVAFISYWFANRDRRTNELEVAHLISHINFLLAQHETKLQSLSSSRSLLEALPRTETLTSNNSQIQRVDLRRSLTEVLNPETNFTAVALFDQSRRQVLFAEMKSNQLVIRDRDFLPGQLLPDDQAWNATGPVRTPVSSSSLGTTLRITVPVVSAEQRPSGVVVGEIDLDSLVRQAVKESKSQIEESQAIDFVVTDAGGKIVYHPNSAYSHQSRSTLNIGASSSEKQIAELNLSVAVLDQTSSTPSIPFYVLISLVLLSLALASIGALLMTRAWERRTSGIEKVTAGVAAIAHGDLDHQIEALSSDAIRPLSDNLNLVTAQLREQIARETEARQFQSFVRLSAMLTHDLKNAIEALSLIVSNMERHFDNEAFRVDAMKSLNLATQKLRSLVDRLTNPVTTLSGEYKRPQPVDLVPMLRRVIKLTAAPALSENQIKTDLPNSLLALVDAERIEKVIENLVLNAVEAMAGTGELTITGGTAEPGKVFFSVSDTGAGMTRDFIERQLFRPFSTTKKRGVGLGLYTCREVIRASSGSIEVDSRQGAGTTFRVVLPSAAIEKV